MTASTPLCEMSERVAPRLRSCPMRHQRAAVDKLLPIRVGALMMEMGTGKTLCAIMLAIARWHKLSKVVWCCPVSLKINTARQILQHTDTAQDRIYVFDERTSTVTMPDADWYIVGLESIGQSDRVTAALNALVDGSTMMVVDESSYIKGHRSKRTRRLTLIGARARYRLILTGTPISQGIEDLYAQMTFLDERVLGYRSWYSFQREHITWSERFKGKIERRHGEDLLSQRMAPYIYHVSKAECLDLPQKMYPVGRYVPLTGEQESLYTAAKERFEREIADLEYGEDPGVAVYRLFGALRAIANGVTPAGFDGHGRPVRCYKTEALLEVLRQVGDSHVVVWVTYIATVEVVRDAIEAESIRVFTYTGQEGEQKRDSALQRWRADGGVLVATPSSGGFGLDLTAARHAIFYSNSFKYAERLQAEDRMHRIGQRHSVSYTDIWALCGIEGRIEDALRRKGNALEHLRAEMQAARELGRGAVAEILRTV